MQLFVEVIFYSNQRDSLPTCGYRPDAIFNKSNEYWGIVFTDLLLEKFDEPSLATIQFSFNQAHYYGLIQGQTFQIMEDPHQVGEGTIITDDNNE